MGLLMRRFSVPSGAFVFTLSPEGNNTSRGRRGANFYDVRGHASLSIKCSSTPPPEVYIAVSLGGKRQCATIQHDFSKKPVFRLPSVLDLWTAIDPAKGTFSLKCTIVARPSDLSSH